MTKIRGSQSSDAQRVVEIWRDAVDATHHFLTAEDRLAIDDEVQSFLPAAPLWLAVNESDRPIAFMLLDGDCMAGLFVDPAHHREGIGRALVAHALESRLDITTDVNEQNSKAIGFYEHLGFVRVGRSEVDGQGRPYPLIHMRLSSSIR